MVGTIIAVVSVLAVLFINMFMLYFVAKVMLDMKDIFEETLRVQIQEASKEEILDAYNRGSIVGYHMFRYTLKMMEDDMEILDSSALMKGIENKMPHIPESVIKQIAEGKDPLKEDNQDDNPLY